MTDLINSTTRRLGGIVPLDGRASWAPVRSGRFQPINCYLIDKGERGVLIDTGVAAHRDIITTTVQEELRGMAAFTVCLTRSELDCTGNLAAVHRARRINELITGALNPFDDYGNGGSDIDKVSSFPIGTDKGATIGDPAFLHVIPAQFRILSTYWMYDAESKTLYSSDLFGHTDMATADSPRIIYGPEDETTFSSAREHLLAKYWWLPKAYTKSLRDWLLKIFVEWDVETIAPTHGCILSGKDTVERHLGFILRVLEEEGLSE